MFTDLKVIGHNPSSLLPLHALTSRIGNSVRQYCAAVSCGNVNSFSRCCYHAFVRSAQVYIGRSFGRDDFTSSLTTRIELRDFRPHITNLSHQLLSLNENLPLGSSIMRRSELRQTSLTLLSTGQHCDGHSSASCLFDNPRADTVQNSIPFLIIELRLLPTAMPAQQQQVMPSQGHVQLSNK